METAPREFSQLELWWYALPSTARWFVGSITLAATAGIAGGVLA